MAATDLNSVRSTVEGRLKDELETGTPPVSVVFSNVPYTPTPNSSWCQCAFSFSSSSYITQGATTSSNNMITGITSVNIFTPKGAGAGANFEIGKRVRDLYNRINLSGVYFDAPIGPEVMSTPSPEGYFQTQVRITFEVTEDL
jgi:hypothetical protein